jgi:hypothetical protein
MDKEIKVQLLKPPFFTPTGVVVDRREAWEKREWFGTFNLWIVQRQPVPAVVYQLRSPTIGWAPNKLDVAAAGHYENLETVRDGLREVREELNRDYVFENLIPLGRRLNVGVGTDGTQRNTVSDLYLYEDDSPLTSYRLEEDEVYALCACPLDELVRVHTENNYSYSVPALKFDGTPLSITVSKDIFPPNWDDYHFKMVLLLKRYFAGEKPLIY